MPRVLIADDNPQNAELLDAHLDGTGFETKIAANGEETLTAVKDWRPDVVLLDVMMPKLSGFDVCERAKQQLGLKDTYIVLLTAKGQEFDRMRGLQVGADLYMTKPFDPDALVQKARAVLGM